MKRTQSKTKWHEIKSCSLYFACLCSVSADPPISTLPVCCGGKPAGLSDRTDLHFLTCGFQTVSCLLPRASKALRPSHFDLTENTNGDKSSSFDFTFSLCCFFIPAKRREWMEQKTTERKNIYILYIWWYVLINCISMEGRWFDTFMALL